MTEEKWDYLNEKWEHIDQPPRRNVDLHKYLKFTTSLYCGVRNKERKGLRTYPRVVQFEKTTITKNSIIYEIDTWVKRFLSVIGDWYFQFRKLKKNLLEEGEYMNLNDAKFLAAMVDKNVQNKMRISVKTGYIGSSKPRLLCFIYQIDYKHVRRAKNGVQVDKPRGFTRKPNN